MSFAIALTDAQWELVADLFDPPGRRGAPARIPRRRMVEAMLFIARTGCQWRYLPERYGNWTAVWAQWRRWRADGVWERAMVRPAALVRVLHDRKALPSMVMVDARTVKGARYGPTFTRLAAPGRPELLAIKDAVFESRDELRDQGITLVSLGPDTIRNRVDVGVLDKVKRARQALSDYGDAVRVFKQSVPQFD
ncbi:MAG: transposase [Chloroflexota bacterium]